VPISRFFTGVTKSIQGPVLFFLLVVQVKLLRNPAIETWGLKRGVGASGLSAQGAGVGQCPPNSQVGGAHGCWYRSGCGGPRIPSSLESQSGWGCAVPLALWLIQRTLGCDPVEIRAHLNIPLHVCMCFHMESTLCPKNLSGKNKY